MEFYPYTNSSTLGDKATGYIHSTCSRNFSEIFLGKSIFTLKHKKGDFKNVSHYGRPLLSTPWGVTILLVDIRET